MCKSYLRWFSELLTYKIFLLRKKSVCISAHKFHDKRSVLPEGYVCKPKGQVSYLNAKTEAGGLQLQNQAELTWHSLKNMEVRFLSPLGLTSSSGALGLRMVSACMPSKALSFCPSFSPLFSYPTTSHIVSFSQDRVCLSSAFPLHFPGPVTSTQRFNTDASLSLWRGIHRDRKHNGVSQCLGEKVFLSTRFRVLVGMRRIPGPDEDGNGTAV